MEQWILDTKGNSSKCYFQNKTFRSICVYVCGVCVSVCGVYVCDVYAYMCVWCMYVCICVVVVCMMYVCVDECMCMCVCGMCERHTQSSTLGTFLCCSPPNFPRRALSLNLKLTVSVTDQPVGPGHPPVSAHLGTRSQICQVMLGLSTRIFGIQTRVFMLTQQAL